MKTNQDILRIAIIIGLIVLGLLFLSRLKIITNQPAEHPQAVAPNPFPSLPQTAVSSSSEAITSPKSDWKASEEPTIQIDLDKL